MGQVVKKLCLSQLSKKLQLYVHAHYILVPSGILLDRLGSRLTVEVHYPLHLVEAGNVYKIKNCL